MNLGPALEARNLAKRYGRQVVALQALDLSIARGTITALVGPNGAGKSTLIKAWVGFERPDRGHVSVLGIDPFRDRAGVLSRIGYVPQATTLYRELTVQDHLDLVESLRPRFDRAHAATRLKQLGIRVGARAGELSGGQQAQVSLALALATGAEVLLLDEPLASLDPLARREFLYILTESIRGSGRTAVLSSHIVTDIEQACDHLVVLSAGMKLLDQRVVDAVSSHAVAIPASPATLPATSIGTFFDPRGGQVTLIHDAIAAGIRAKGAEVRPATLEEVVLGYLAAGRTPMAAEGTART